MALSVAEARRNGTGAPMPIKTAEITLDDAGYPGWHATVRVNPRSSTFDDLLSEDPARQWKAFGAVVLGWNFADEHGEPIPLPSTVERAANLDLPVDLFGAVFRKYFEAFNAAAAPPKASENASATTSSTSGASQGSG